MSSNFESPSRKLNWLVMIGGIITGVAIVMGLQLIAERWSDEFEDVSNQNTILR